MLDENKILTQPTPTLWRADVQPRQGLSTITRVIVRGLNHNRDRDALVVANVQGWTRWPTGWWDYVPEVAIVNTHLIAAAPEMFAALNVVALDPLTASWLEEWSPTTLRQMRDAIAKAKGVTADAL